MVVHQDEGADRMTNYRPKDIPRIRQRFVKAGLSDVNHHDQPLAGLKQDYTRDLLIEKLHFGAGDINGVRAIEDSKTRIRTIGNGRKPRAQQPTSPPRGAGEIEAVAQSKHGTKL